LAITLVVRAALEAAVDPTVLEDARDRRRIQAIRDGLANDERLLAKLREAFGADNAPQTGG
jgi:hypothetical protein